MTTYQSSPLILVIEDDDHIAQILKFMLDRQGYRTVIAADGQAARDFIESGDAVPALVLLDVMLPYLDGFEVVGIIRAQAAWQDVPIVMLTAKSTNRRRSQSFASSPGSRCPGSSRA